MKNNKLPFGRVALYSMASAGLNILAITIGHLDLVLLCAATRFGTSHNICPWHGSAC